MFLFQIGSTLDHDERGRGVGRGNKRASDWLIVIILFSHLEFDVIILQHQKGFSLSSSVVFYITMSYHCGYIIVHLIGFQSTTQRPIKY